MKLQCVIIASDRAAQNFKVCADFDTLFFDDLAEFLLIQGRLSLAQSMVVWLCEKRDELSLLRNISSDLANWIVVGSHFSSDDFDYLFNAGVASILPQESSLDVVRFHLKKLERDIWRRLTTFDPYEGVCYLFGTKVEGLTKKEIQLLKLFVLRDDHRVEKDEVVATIWKDTLVNSKTLDVHFYNLRRKLAPYGIQIKLVRRGEWQLQL